MRYGFYLPTRGGCATAEALETIVQRGEALGFHSVMIADHVVFPTAIASKYPYTVSGAFPGGGDALEQLALMAFVAGRTRTLRLVTSVMILPYRNPVVTAKMLATIDVLSRGRVTVGVGVGWLREEFEALDSPDFDRRGAASDEYIRIFKTLWTRESRQLQRRVLPLRRAPLPAAAGAEAAPADLDRRPQHAGAAPRRASWRRLAPGRRQSRRAAAAGRAARVARPALPDDRGGGSRPGGADDLVQGAGLRHRRSRRSAGPIAGRSRVQPSRIADDIGTYEKLGVSELVFDFRSEHLTETLDRMERFAQTMRLTRSAASG